MKIDVTIARFDILNCKMIIGGYFDEELNIVFKQRKTHIGVQFLSEYTFNLEHEGNQFYSEIDLQPIFKLNKVNSLFDVYLVNNEGNEVYLSLENWPKVRFDKYISSDKVLYFQPYKNQKGNLSIRIKPHINLSLENIKVNDNKALLGFEVSESIRTLDVRLYLQPLFNDVDLNQNAIELKLVTKNDYSVQFLVESNDLIKYLNFDKFKSIMTIKGEFHDIKLPITANKQISKTFTVGYEKIQFDMDPSDGLCIMKKTNEISNGVKQLTFDGKVMIKIEVRDLPLNIAVNNVYMVPRLDKFDSNYMSGFIYLDIQHTEKGGVNSLNMYDAIISAGISKEKLNELYMQDDVIYDFYFDVKDDQGIVYKNNLNVDSIVEPNTYSINDKFDMCFYETQKGTLSFRFNKKRPINQMKIAVHGSCYSRLPFYSNHYFNPDYKEKYDVVLTSFHKSTIGLFTPSIELPDESLSDLNKSEANVVKDDSEKNFFRKLQNLNPEYLIIDFYADAVLDLMRFNNGTILTVTPRLSNSKLFLNKYKGEVEIINHNDFKVFMEMWRPAIKKFTESVIKYIPENKIILTKARMSEKYYDKEENLIEFKGKRLEEIKKYNVIFSILESEFLRLLPKTRVIQLPKNKYFSDENFPLGFSPNHYQTGYYKEYLSKLDDLVYKDLISKRLMD
ncbi:hypothetical protein JOC34_002565 [Virgibacillus halotolerans]|uniref:DUF6270 domain-containing protein n=1 Tax=Virgibacillus halotolerans TaxID=1071053 RepID=UPI0019601F46|nr:DUF6270 domain-containing protein [Virgibacillus halotolerans]MBM7600174.1 hypothetical protein [Virgibacillus halotolerans]